jgi:hypothetical protein
MAVSRGSGSRSDEAISSAEGVAKDLETALRLRLEQSPLLTFALAGGVGYILGGGLTLGVLTRLVGAGVRAAVALRVQRIISDWLSVEGRSKGPRQAS